MSSLKLALAISNHGTMLGGGEHSFLDLVCRLPFNWEVITVLPDEGDLAERLRKKGFQTTIIPMSSIKPWLIAKVLCSLKAFWNICRKNRPILIYANGSRAAFYGGLVGRILGIPVIWHCRIADPDPKLDFFLIRVCTRIITNSHATAKRFKESIQKKVSVVYNGIDIGWFQSKNIGKPDIVQDEWKVILIVARVSRWKRHDLALMAFEHVAKIDHEVHLVCIGSKDQFDPDWWDLLQERTNRSTFSNRIHWVDQVNDVRPWYRSASMLVLASDNESFGRVLVEAMACGIPVVATRSGGVPEIVRHGQDGFLVKPDKYREISKVIIRILEDRLLRERLGRSGIERAKAFALDTHVFNMDQIFEDIIK